MLDDNISEYVPQRLAKLFNLSTEDNTAMGSEVGEDVNEMKAGHLHTLLSSGAPLDHILAQTLPDVLIRVCQELAPLASNNIGAILSNPGMDIAVIERLKGYAKQLSKSAGSEAEYETAIVVYYGAIAHALVNYDQKITSRPDDRLRAAFDRLGDTPWLTGGIITLFEKASSVCEARAKRK